MVNTKQLEGTLTPIQGGTGTSSVFGTGSVVFAGSAGIYQEDDGLQWDQASGALSVRSEMWLRSPAGSSSSSGSASPEFHVGFKAPASLSANQVWELPAIDGLPAQVLATDGAGTLYWSDCCTSGSGGGGNVTSASGTINYIPMWGTWPDLVDSSMYQALLESSNPSLVMPYTYVVGSLGGASTLGSPTYPWDHIRVSYVDLCFTPGADVITIAPPLSPIGSYQITLPASVGSAGQALVATDGAGTMAWSTVAVLSAPTDTYVQKYITSGSVLVDTTIREATGVVFVQANLQVGDGGYSGNFNIANSNGDCIAFQAYNNPFFSYTLYWPVDDGSPTQVLTTDGAGNLYWSDCCTSSSGSGSGNVTSSSGATGYLPKWGTWPDLVNSNWYDDGSELQASLTIRPTNSFLYTCGTAVNPWYFSYARNFVLSDGTNGITFALPSLLGSFQLTWPANDGLPAQVLATDGAGNLYWSDCCAVSSSGSGGTPGGPTGSIQFNNGGAFDGTSAFTWSDAGVSNRAVVLDGASLDVFHGYTKPYIRLGTSSMAIRIIAGDDRDGIQLSSGYSLAWSSTTNAEDTADTRLYRDAANRLMIINNLDTLSRTYGELRLSGVWFTSGETYKITMSAPTLSGDYSFILPQTAGLPGQVLATDGAGNMYWSDCCTGSTSSGTCDCGSGTINYSVMWTSASTIGNAPAYWSSDTFLPSTGAAHIGDRTNIWNTIDGTYVSASYLGIYQADSSAGRIYLQLPASGLSTTLYFTLPNTYASTGQTFITTDSLGTFGWASVGVLSSANVWTNTNSIAYTSATAFTVKDTGGSNTYFLVDTSNKIVSTILSSMKVSVNASAKTTTYQIILGDNTILCDPTSGGSFDVTLPAAALGLIFTVKHIGTANTVTLKPASGTIDGQASEPVNVGDAKTVISDGANWFLI